MQVQPGQIIVHPFHGVMRVQGITTRRLKRGEVDYVELTDLGGALAVSIPVETTDTVGLRPVVTREKIHELMGVLASPADTKREQWSRRNKAHQERLHSGDNEQLCVVIRGILGTGDVVRGSAQGQMLQYAIGHVSAEFAEALGMSGEEAESLIERAVRGADAPADLVPAA